jgi:hypothetical protein
MLALNIFFLAYSCLDLPRRSMPVANVEKLYQSTKRVAHKMLRDKKTDVKINMGKKKLSLKREFHRT